MRQFCCFEEPEDFDLAFSSEKIRPKQAAVRPPDLTPSRKKDRTADKRICGAAMLIRRPVQPFGARADRYVVWLITQRRQRKRR